MSYENIMKKTARLLKDSISSDIDSAFSLIQAEAQVGQDASNAGNYFSQQEQIRLFPLFSELAQKAQKKYQDAFLEAGIPQEQVALQWMTVYAQIENPSPRFTEIKPQDVHITVQEKIIEEHVEKSNTGKALTPVIGGLVGAVIGGVAANSWVTGAFTGGMIGIVAGFVTYKVVIEPMGQEELTEDSIVRVKVDKYKIDAEKLERLCGQEARRIKEEACKWLDALEDAVLNSRSWDLKE